MKISFLNGLTFLLTVMGTGMVALGQSPAGSVAVAVGDLPIELPVPKGAEAGTQEGAHWESIEPRLINPSNRLVAYFTLPDDPAIFHAQTPKGIELIDCSIEQFGEMTHAISAQFIAETEEGAGKGVGALLAEARKGQPKGAGSQGDLSSLDVGETRSLGIHDKGAHHVSFAILGRTESETSLGGKEGSGLGEVTYTVATMCNVAGKVVNLYCLVEAGSEERAQWAREALGQWREAVQASNSLPRHEAEMGNASGNGWGSLKSRLMIGVAASGLAGLLIGVVQRQKPGASTPISR